MHLDRLFNELQDDNLYRFHLAKTEPGGTRPIDALSASEDAWLKWQVYKGNTKERFTTEYIISFAHVAGNRFLFGGVFRILSRNAKFYRVEYVDDHRDLIGRLVIEYNGGNSRATVFRPSYIFSNSLIAGIYEHRFKGEPFVSFEEINHGFSAIELIVNNNLPDWRVALSSVYGVYLISDRSSGKQYVGSASGAFGIWGRWQTYITTFHGTNEDLVELFNDKSESYFRKNFMFSILEVIPLSRSQDEVLQKEALWKRKLLTRVHGYNRN